MFRTCRQAARHWAANRVWLLGYATRHRRTLPQFLICGAQKCGTTSLFEYLVQTGRVQRGVRKEVHYFDRNFQRGEGWYRAHFPTFGSCKGIVGEATPQYMFHPHAMERIALELSAVKIVIILRDPVQRAISHYTHVLSRGYETLNFGSAIRCEEDRIGKDWERMCADPNYYSRNVLAYSYKSRGLYSNQLQRIFRFFDRENIKIVFSEDLFSNPTSVVHDVISFLEDNSQIEVSDVTDLSNITLNAARVEREVKADDVDYLKQYFSSPNQELKEMVDRQPDWS